GPGEVLLDADAADDLAARPGDEIVLFAGERVLPVRVAAVGTYEGTTSDEGSALVPLDVAPAVLGRPGEVNHVLVANTGGVGATDEVEPALDAALAPLGLEAQPTKRDALDDADELGNAFVQLFTTFGSFSMAAGILLIFLIFV